MIFRNFQTNITYHLDLAEHLTFRVAFATENLFQESIFFIVVDFPVRHTKTSNKQQSTVQSTVQSTPDG